MKTYSRTAHPGEYDLWAGKSILLEDLSFDLTERCNNNCVHCFINRPPHDPHALARELTTSGICSILDEAASLGCLKVRFSGGEPLLREDFSRIYSHARKLGMVVEILTNATLITDGMADLFKKIPPRRKIVVSFYGISKESYENVSRIPGSFAAALKGVNRLMSRKIPFELNIPLLPQNRHEQKDLKSWVYEHFSIDDSPGSLMLLDLHSRGDVLRSESIRKNRISPQEYLKMLTKDEDLYIRNAKIFFAHRIRLSGPQLFPCGAGLGRGTVDAYGRLQMCTRLRHPGTTYDLKKGSLKDAYTDFFPEIRRLSGSDPEYLSRCARCFLRGFCEHCPAASWSESGSLDSVSEYLCEIAHLQARFLGIIDEGEKAWEVGDWRERLENFVRDGSSQKKDPKK